MSATPPYTYDASAGRFRASSGRFVSVETVHQWNIETTQAAGKFARDLTQQLRDGSVTVAEWQTQMMQLVKDAHLAAAIAANGGVEQMTFSDYGRVGQIIRGEYAYLRDFANGVADGSVPLDGRVLQRAEQYMRAARETYSAVDRVKMQALGYDEESNIRYEGDSCDDCIEAEDAGWVPIGTLSLPGSRQCRANCRCRLAQRRSSDVTA